MDADSDGSDAETCIICAQEFTHVALGECNHNDVCALCTLRMRLLLRDDSCCLCKTDQEQVIVTNDLEKRFQDFEIWGNKGAGLEYFDEASAFFDDPEFLRHIKTLQSIVCSICEEKQPNSRTFATMPELEKHLSERHGVAMCKLCVQNRKIFLQEQPLMNKHELKKHETQGDESGFNGHPLCEFCNKRFYDDNALWDHLRRDHFNCHLCQRAGQGANEFYSTYQDLEEHYRAEHILCEDEGCRSLRFMAFANEIDFMAHNAQHHRGVARAAPSAARVRADVPFTVRFRPRPNARAAQSAGSAHQAGEQPSSAEAPSASAQQEPPTHPEEAAAAPRPAGASASHESYPALSHRVDAASREDFPALPTPGSAPGIVAPSGGGKKKKKKKKQGAVAGLPANATWGQESSRGSTNRGYAAAASSAPAFTRLPGSNFATRSNGLTVSAQAAATKRREALRVANRLDADAEAEVAQRAADRAEQMGMGMFGGSRHLGRHGRLHETAWVPAEPEPGFGGVTVQARPEPARTSSHNTAAPKFSNSDFPGLAPTGREASGGSGAWASVGKSKAKGAKQAVSKPPARALASDPTPAQAMAQTRPEPTWQTQSAPPKRAPKPAAAQARPVRRQEAADLRSFRSTPAPDDLDTDYRSFRNQPSSAGVSEEAKTRVKKLVRDTLTETEMEWFKVSSKEFRCGNIDCATYYSEFASLFLELHSQGLFAAMLSMLPDPTLREGLREMHESAMTSRQLETFRR